jgi:hypothetical protein
MRDVWPERRRSGPRRWLTLTLRLHSTGGAKLDAAIDANLKELWCGG